MRNDWRIGKYVDGFDRQYQGADLIGATKLKIADMLPALLFVPLVYWGAQYLPI